MNIWTLFVSIYMTFVLPGHAQENPQSLRGDFTIAVIKSRDSSLHNAALSGFRAALQDKDVNASISVYNIEDDTTEREIVSRIKTTKPDLIVTLGTMATKAASEGITDLPIVFSVVLNPVDSGLVKSMKSSGNNLTGASMDIPVKTQFEWFKKVVPNVKTIGVLYNPDETKTVIDEAVKVAEEMKLKLIAVPVYSEKEVPKAAQDLMRRVDALWPVADSTVFSSPQAAQFILLHTLRTKTPFMGLSSAFVKAGALFTVGCNYEDIGRQSGELAARTLAGEKPGGNAYYRATESIFIA